MTEARQGSPFDIVRAIWNRRKWLALVVFSIPLSAVVGVATHLPNTYQSSARIVIERQQVPEAFVRPTVTSELENRLRTITDEVLSRSRLQQLIDRFGLYSELKGRVPPEAIIERVRGDIRPLKLEASESVGRGMMRASTVAFTISVRGRNPQTLADITNGLASFYIEENLKVRERLATGTAQFLKVQLDETKKRLHEHERRVSDFKRRHIGELPQQMAANLSLLERLSTQLSLNNASLTRALERREMLARQLAEGDPVAPAIAAAPGAVPETPAVRLARLKQELTALTARFTDKYPEVIRVRTEIANLEGQLVQPRPDGGSQPETLSPVTPQILRLRQALNELDGEIKVLRGEETNLRAAMEAYQRRIENTPRREQESLEINRDYETTKELYQSLQKRHEEAQLAESLEQSQKGEQFRILDPALPSHEPAAPRRVQLLLMGLILSLGLALGAAVLAEQLDTSFHTLDDLRSAAPAPVLVSIPRIVTEADSRRRRRQGRVVAAAALAGLLLVFGASSFVAKENQELVLLLSRESS